MRHAYRLRRAVNIANGSTLGGLLVAAVGRARFAPGPDGLTVAHRLRLPMRSDAFCVGNVILTRLDAARLPQDGPLFAHEARHTPSTPAAAAWSCCPCTGSPPRCRGC